MPDRLVLVRQSSHIRVVSDAEVLTALGDELRGLPRTDVHVDMRPFAADVEGGYWDRSEGYIIQQAQEIRAAADGAAEPAIAFFGLAEVPHLLALGAYVGDERRVQLHDLYSEDWVWPEDHQTVSLREPTGLPTARVGVSGEVVVRVEVTYPVSTDDVNEVVPQDRFDDVTLGLSKPDRGVVRSAQDVAAIRGQVREALAEIRAHYPRLERIHLVCAAPASVCFAIGQELQIRNNVPVVTYRYRPGTDGHALREAIVLTPGEAATAARPLTDEEKAEAAEVRTGAWTRALDLVVRYATSMQRDNRDREVRAWFEPLQIAAEAGLSAPFPELPPLWGVVNSRSSVDPEPLPGVDPPYALPKTTWAWKLTDALLLAQRRSATAGDGTVDGPLLERLVRLFLFHESLHEHHVLTKYTALGVGRFPNVLERLDYMADLYAALHELDYTARQLKTLTTPEALHDELVQVLDDVLHSHWAFVDADEDAPRWQVRHIRRFLNWYWRLAQVNRARELPRDRALAVALQVLAEPPAVEIAGLEQQVGGRRVYARLDKLDRTTEFSLGLVLENAHFFELTDSANVNLRELMAAFVRRDHEEIKTFFQTVFEKAKQAGGALPPQ
jgi:hypothetical protein